MPTTETTHTQTNRLYGGHGYVYRAEEGVKPYSHRHNENIWKPMEENMSYLNIDITHTVSIFYRPAKMQRLMNSISTYNGFGILIVNLEDTHHFMLSNSYESVLIETATKKDIWIPKALFLGSLQSYPSKCKWIIISNGTDPLYIQNEHSYMQNEHLSIEKERGHSYESLNHHQLEPHSKESPQIIDS